MCDGAKDETTWTIRIRGTGQTLETESGYSYLFSEESDALDFIRSQANPPSLEIVAIPVPPI